MPEPFRHRLEVGAAGQRKSGCAVPQVVQPDRRQPGVPGQPLEVASGGGTRAGLRAPGDPEAGLETAINVDDASYFLSTIELRPGDAPGMARWRKGLFVATAQITADAAEYFGLPRERTVIIGSRMTV